MKLRPVLSASAAGVLIAAASAVPSLASEEEDNTEDPSSIEDLLDETAEPVRPSVEVPKPPAVPAEAPTSFEAVNSPIATGQAESNNSGNAPGGIDFGPQNLPIVPAEAVPFARADAPAQLLLSAQNSQDNGPAEETTAGTSEAPGRVESRRIVRPDQPAAAAPQENITNPQTSPSNPDDSRSAPPNNLVTTGAASALLAIGGVLMIAGGAGILFWHRHSTSK